MSRLHLFPTEAALETALDRLFAENVQQSRSAVEIGRGLTSVPRLLDEAADPEIGLGLDSLAETLLVRELENERARAAVLGTSAARLRAPLAALRRAGIAPSMLRSLRLVGSLGEDARWLAAVLERYEALLGVRADGATRVRASLSRLARAPIACLHDATLIDAHDLDPFDPLQRAMVEALCARGLTVRCRLPDAPPRVVESGASSYEDALAEAAGAGLDALEAISASGVERARVEVGNGPMPSVLSAPSPAIEARELARQIRDRIAEGQPPDGIAVVAQDPAARARIVESLRRYRVPVEQAATRSARDTIAARFAITIYRLLDEDLPRDALADLVRSRALRSTMRPSHISAGRLARTLREATPATMTAAGYRDALTAWTVARPPEQRADAELVVRTLLRIIERISSLPPRATIARQVAALQTLLGELSASDDEVVHVAPPDSGAAQAMAREHAGRRALTELLEDLPRAASRAGLSARVYARREFADRLEAELEGISLRVGGARGAAVLVCELSRLPLASRSLLVLSGLEEGVLPAPANEDPLLPDALRHVLNRALGKKVLPLSRDHERSSRLRLARARSLADELVLSFSRADADGGPRNPGELIEHARAMGAVETRLVLRPIPRVDEARSPNELVARLQLETEGELAARQGLSPHALATLEARLQSETLDRVERLAAIERSRGAFFGRERSAGRHEGRIGSEQALAQLVARALPGTAARPLSASTLARYVECPHRFFLESVLRLRPIEGLTDELDERDAGALAHLALERLFSAWRDAKLIPLVGRDEERQLIATALAQAVDEWSLRRPRGNELVFRGRIRTLGRMLERVWRREIEDPPAPGLHPTHFELAFDGVAVPGETGEPPVYLRGAIDRVDILGERAAVFDYKSGRLQPLKADMLAAAWGASSWQLPLYAAVVRAQLGVRDVDMIYYSLKELSIARGVAPARLSFAHVPDDPEPGLPTLLWDPVRRMRRGQFDVSPQPGACERCTMQPVCRVAERRCEDEPESGEIA